MAYRTKGYKLVLDVMQCFKEKRVVHSKLEASPEMVLWAMRLELVRSKRKNEGSLS